MSKITFYQITDIHNLSLSDAKNESEYKTAFERKAVRDVVYDYMIADKDTEVIIFSGDIADHGKYTEHKEFIEHTQKLKDAGKKIYLITATHDFGLVSVDKNGESEKRDNVAQRSELGPMYEQFGYNDAISSFDKYSYVVKPQDNFRIMMLNDDGDGILYRGYSKDQKIWIKEQFDDAYKSGDFVIVVTHHPMLPPSPIYSIIGKNELLGDNMEVAELFADNGVKFLFTGHTHMQAISSYTSKQGNKIYEINTGTISEFPLSFRKVTIENGVADVKTIPVPDVCFDTNGKSANQYFADDFDLIIPQFVKGMAEDFELLQSLLLRVGISGDGLEKHKRILRITGRFLDKATFGSIGRMLLCSSKVDKSIKDVKIVQMLSSILHIVYGGDEPYSPDTPEHKAIMAFLDRTKHICKIVEKKSGIDSLKDLVSGMIWDPTPDSDAILD